MDTYPRFNELIGRLSNPEGEHWQSAWQEFMKRYKGSIYRTVINRCHMYKIPRVQQQLTEVVDDIVMDVFIILSRNDCKALRDFRQRDSETAFLAWLQVICRRVADNYLKSNFINLLSESTDLESQVRNQALSTDLRWQLYEDIVQILRMEGKHKKNLERDILIFTLYTFSGFDFRMISVIPGLGQIGSRVIDLIVSRMRKYLRSKQEEKEP